jgi:hypothetical protein
VATRFVTGGREGPARVPPVAVLLVYLMLLTTAVAQAAAGVPALVVRDAQGSELARFALDESPRWHLAWRHSVTGNLVRDHYEVRDGTMLLTQSHTPAYDAGLGHIPGRGRAESDGEGGYWIRDIDEPVPGNAYWLRVGSERVGHTVVHGDRRVNLSDHAAGERVRIALETR